MVAIACAERHVVGLDVSDNAIKKAIEVRMVLVFFSSINHVESSQLSFLDLINFKFDGNLRKDYKLCVVF